MGKPTSSGGGFQPSGPAVDIAFVNGLSGGRLFATNSNQSTHRHNGQNNSSRIITVDPMTGVVTPFITNLPTGDHPTEQLAFRGDRYGSTGRKGRRPTAALSVSTMAAARTSPTSRARTSRSARTSSSRVSDLPRSYERRFAVRRAKPGAITPAFFNSLRPRFGRESATARIAGATEHCEQHRGFRLGAPERLRDPFCTGRSSFGRCYWSARTGPTNAAPDPRTALRKCSPARPSQSRRHTGLSWLARPLRLPADEPGGIQSGRRRSSSTCLPTAASTLRPTCACYPSEGGRHTDRRRIRPPRRRKSPRR